MDKRSLEPPPSPLGHQYPSWLSAIEDEEARSGAEQLYSENQDLQRKHEGNLKYVSSLRSQCTVQQERIERLERRRAIAIIAIGGGLGIVGLAALLITNYPTLGAPVAVFLIVLLARACFPALLELLRTWAKGYASDRF